MLNFSMLSLNENDMPEIFQDNNDILNSETMEDLFINIMKTPIFLLNYYDKN
jgi:hypothetical protein